MNINRLDIIHQSPALFLLISKGKKEYAGEISNTYSTILKILDNSGDSLSPKAYYEIRHLLNLLSINQDHYQQIFLTIKNLFEGFENTTVDRTNIILDLCAKSLLLFSLIEAISIQLNVFYIQDVQKILLKDDILITKNLLLSGEKHHNDLIKNFDKISKLIEISINDTWKKEENDFFFVKDYFGRPIAKIPKNNAKFKHFLPVLMHPDYFWEFTILPCVILGGILVIITKFFFP